MEKALLVVTAVAGVVSAGTDAVPFNVDGVPITAFTDTHLGMMALGFFIVSFLAISWIFKSKAITGMFNTLHTSKERLEKIAKEMQDYNWSTMYSRAGFLLGFLGVYSVLWLLTDIFLGLGYAFFYMTDGIDTVTHWVLIVFFVLFLLEIIVRANWPIVLFEQGVRDHTLLSAIVVGGEGMSTGEAMYAAGFMTGRGAGFFLQLCEIIIVTLTIIFMAIGMSINSWWYLAPFYTLGSAINTACGIMAIVFLSLSWIMLVINAVIGYIYTSVVQPITASQYYAFFQSGAARVMRRRNKQY